MLPRTKVINTIKASKIFKRLYAVRGEFDSPLDYLPKHVKRPFINWKWTVGFIVTGSYLAYNEVILDKYAELTESEEQNQLLPIQLRYKLTQLPIYQQIVHSKNETWNRLETWEDLDHNILDKQDFSGNATKKTQSINDKNEPEEFREVMSHTLAKPGGFLIKPVIFHNPETNDGITILHAGYRLSGYPLIIHGGIIASILNETFKRNAALNTSTSSNYKGDFKVENISINYKSPTFANQFLILRTKRVPIELKDRCDVNGTDNKWIKLQTIIESESGKKLVMSEALLHDTGLYSNSKKSFLGFSI